MAKESKKLAVDAVASVTNLAAKPAEGLARVEILVDTAVGAARVTKGQVVDIAEHDASHLCIIAKARAVV